MQRFDGRNRRFKWPLLCPKNPYWNCSAANVTLPARHARGSQVMKFLGFMLLLAGWAIVVCAMALLQAVPRVAFAYAGMGVEVLGLVLVIRSHPLLRGEE
jgi:hypothetical protein